MHHEPEPGQGDSPPERPTQQIPVYGEHQPPSPNDPAPTEQFPPATDHGYVTPPPPPPSDPYGTGPSGPGPQEPKRSRGKVAALIAVGVLLLGGAAFAGVMLVSKTSAPPDELAKMVPATDEAYVTAFLDPGADQKLNLRDLLDRFPALQGKDPAKSIDELLEQALRPSGLSWVEDFKPWVGDQIGVSGRFDDNGQPNFSVMIASKDDEKARTTLRRVEGLSSNAELTWRSETYKGVEIRVGEGGGNVSDPLGGIGANASYAIVDHTLVLGTSLQRVKAVIDANGGTGDVLSDDENFQKARDALPDEVLGYTYLNLGDLIDKVIPQLEAGLGFSELPPGCGGDELNQSLDAARALRGASISLTAESDGLAIDMGVAMDRSKLPKEAQAVVDSEPHENVVLSYTPADAFGMFSETGAQALDQVAAQFAKCDPNVKEQLDKFGVQDILSNLSGDIGVEVSPGTSGGTPQAALIAGVTDEAKMKSSLDRLVQQMAAEGGSEVQRKSETYKGVEIESVGNPSDPNVVPSWAVADGVAIIATSPDEVKAALDAHDGENITGTPTFEQTAARIDLENNVMLFVDVQKVLGLVPAGNGADGLPDFDSIVENLRPLKATALVASSDGDVFSVRWFFLVP
jgi:hypothetical protein